jgi:uncharacterized protein (TIGR02996 family)
MNPSDLLRAIAAAPDDDAPRLVYADWLEQQGDPRGELIVVQCALAALEAEAAGLGEVYSSPTGWTGPREGSGGHPVVRARRDALEAREKELLAAHRGRWMAELGLAPAEGTFRRGFVEEVILGRSRLLAVHDTLASAAAPIRGLRLYQTPGEPAFTLARLMELSFLGRLSRLNLKSVPLNDAGARALAGTHNLRGLSFLALKTSLTDDDLEVLRALFSSPNLSGLTSLDLSFGNVGLKGANILAALPQVIGKVTHLNLGSSRLKTEGALALLSSRSLSRVTHLDLSGNEIDVEEALAAFGALNDLVSLNLSGNTGRPGGTRGIEAAPEPARLLELNLSYNEMGDGGAKALAALPHLGRLTTLHLWGTELGPAGVEALASSPHFAHLTSLSLGQNRAGPEGALALATAPSLARLERLNLWENQLGDKGAKALATSTELGALTQLDLGKNGIRSTGARALAASPLAARLTELDLRSNPIGDDGAAAFAASPHLSQIRQLNLRYCSVAGKFADLLRERFGDRVLL